MYKPVNFAYTVAFIGIFCFTLYSIFDLKLLNDKQYYTVIGGWSKAMGIELKYNLQCAFTILFLILITIICFTVIIHERISYGVRGFICIMLCGANGIIITNDIFNSYVFFEIICITTYIIYAHGDSIFCLKNSYNYMILSCFVGTVFLFIAGILYQITGNLNINLINSSISNFNSNKTISAIFVLFVLAMMFKIGLYPLHNIIYNIYQSLPIKYLLFASGISSIVYPYFITKFIIDLFGNEVIMNNEYLNITLKIFGGIGFIFFNSIALSTPKVLQFIISISFAQTSLFAFCIPYLTERQVINGVIFAITSHTLLKVCMLCLLNDIQSQKKLANINKSDVSCLSSNIYKILFIILLFFSAGMPLSLVFMSKWYILVGIFSTAENLLWLAILIIGFTIEIFACFLFIKQILSSNNKTITVKTNYMNTCILVFAISVLIFSTLFVNSFKNVL